MPIRGSSTRSPRRCREPRGNGAGPISSGNLLAKVPKSAGPFVATLVRSIFAQPDADAVWAQFHRHGIITTIAGNGKDGYSGDGGPATSANLHPGKVVVDSRGNVYIRGAAEDKPCGCVRMVDRRGIITTVVGRRTQGFSGDGGPAK